MIGGVRTLVSLYPTLPTPPPEPHPNQKREHNRYTKCVTLKQLKSNKKPPLKENKAKHEPQKQNENSQFRDINKRKNPTRLRAKLKLKLFQQSQNIAPATQNERAAQ